MGSTGARWRTVTQAHPRVLCALCSSSWALCSTKATVCVSCFLKGLWDSIQDPPVPLLVVNERQLTWVKHGWIYEKKSYVAPPHAHPYSPAYPTDSFSSSRCKEKPAGWSNVFRFCEHAQDVYSCHAGLQLRHALLPPPPPAAAEAVQLQPATFNLAECSRHLNYLTVVLVQGGGRRG